MKILLPNEIAQKLVMALKKAGHREIGGILMGEHVAEMAYRVKEITIQYHGGAFASFVRIVKDIIVPLKMFFRRAGNNFTRFNYLGEWHSHPAFIPEPSGQDSETMWEIVEDKDVGANFAVLMIVRLDEDDGGRLVGTVTVYLPERRKFTGEFIKEA